MESRQNIQGFQPRAQKFLHKNDRDKTGTAISAKPDGGGEGWP